MNALNEKNTTPSYISFIQNRLASQSWVVWIILILFGLFFLWLFFGRGNYEYIGLSPLKIGVDSTKFINDHTKTKIENSNWNAEKITVDDLSIEDDYSNDDSNDYSDDSNDNEISLIEEGFGLFESRKCSKGEQKCREVLEEIFGKPFPTKRPNFLKNPETKRNLELDCYNEELKIAVERNGVQHYVWPNFTGQTKEEFIKQIRRDRFKREKCDEEGVYLITVPYTVPIEKIKEYIIRYLPV